VFQINCQILEYIINELDLRVTNETVIKILEGTENFSLAWEYTVLLLFLDKIDQLNFPNLKVDKIIQKLLKPIIENILPNQHSKWILLILAFEEVKCKIKLLHQSSIDKLKRNFLEKVHREKINNELTFNSAFLQNGTSGVSWIYKRLFEITGKKTFQEEAFYWLLKTFDFGENNQGYAGFYIEKEQTALGLFAGLAGIAFISNHQI
jgi:hypothetical protein